MVMIKVAIATVTSLACVCLFKVALGSVCCFNFRSLVQNEIGCAMRRAMICDISEKHVNERQVRESEE